MKTHTTRDIGGSCMLDNCACSTENYSCHNLNFVLTRKSSEVQTDICIYGSKIKARGHS